MDTYYKIAERGGIYIYHWIIYNLGGLRHITGQKPCKISVENFASASFQKESLEIIKDTYIYEEPPLNSNVVKLPGEQIFPCGDMVATECLHFLRSLFLPRIPKEPVPPKPLKVYCVRKQISEGHGTRRIRHILNEDDYIDDIRQLGFIIVQLEDYTFGQKVKLFSDADLIVGPNSGGLTFSTFMRPHTKLIEICPEEIQYTDQYKNICHQLDINFIRYSNIQTVGDVPEVSSHWNMILDKSHFIEFIKTNI